MSLTRKQQRFVEEYLIDLNATAAYQRAGYKANSERAAQSAASRLLSNVIVQTAITELTVKRTGRVEITQDYVLAMLHKNMLRAMQEVPVLDKEGSPTGQYRYEGSVANRALELLGKHLGTFSDKIEHTGPGGAAIPHAHDVKHHGNITVAIDVNRVLGELAGAIAEGADQVSDERGIPADDLGESVYPSEAPTV